MLRRIELGKLVTNNSVLQYLTVDGSHLYISDAGSRAFIVYDTVADRGCRVVLPKAVEHGCSRRDVLYNALVRRSNGESAVYFTYLSAKNVYSVSTSDLKAGTNKSKVKLVGSKTDDSIVFLGTDNAKTIYLRMASNCDVYAWDTDKPFASESFCLVYRSDTSCLLPTHVATDNRLGRLRVLQSNFPDFMRNTVGCGAVQRLALVE